MATLFNADFSNGTLFDSTNLNELIVVKGGTIELVDAASPVTGKRIAFTPVTNYAAYIGRQLNPAVKRIRQRMYFNPNGITLADGGTLRLAWNDMNSYGSNGNMYAYRITYIRTGSTYYMRIGAYVDTSSSASSTNVATTWIASPGARMLIEWDWKAADNADTHNGWLKLWVDASPGDLPDASITSLDNDTLEVRQPVIGLPTALTSGDAFVGGPYYIDNWKANDDGTEIGAI